MNKRYIIPILMALLIASSTPNTNGEEAKLPVVSGLFYPDSPEALARKVDDFLSKAEATEINGEISVLIVPHAGYDYSGGVAGYGFKAVQGRSYDTVIVIGPSHHSYFDGISVYEKGAFRTPLGDVAIDSELASALINAHEKISFYPEAFDREHSVEVEVPFLQRVLGNCKIVPIVFGTPSYENCQILAGALVNTNRDKKNVLVVVSTDLSHYHPYDEAVDIDRLTVSYVERLDVEPLFEKAVHGGCELCGLGPMISSMIYAKSIGADKVKVLKYANSGDVTGDKRRVVGYMSAVLYKTSTMTPKEEGAEEMLSDEQRKKLLETAAISIDYFKKEGAEGMLNDYQKERLLAIARKSIEEYVKKGERTKFAETDPVLLKEKGAFVTIKKGGMLRGCIGHIIGDKPLCETVAEMAVQAATGDPRFPALTPSESKEMELEISVLSELEKIDDVNKIEVGTHGILIRKGFNSGLLLPQVATEYGWDRKEFLEQTCYKAGLPLDAWKSNADIYIFSAEVFGEKSID